MGVWVYRWCGYKYWEFHALNNNDNKIRVDTIVENKSESPLGFGLVVAAVVVVLEVFAVVIGLEVMVTVVLGCTIVVVLPIEVPMVVGTAQYIGVHESESVHVYGLLMCTTTYRCL